jgi:hypothetical protein
MLTGTFLRAICLAALAGLLWLGTHAAAAPFGH